MKLYHGTSEWAAIEALEKGLHPRGNSGIDNWEHTVSSNPRAVYLTDTYACHFAMHAMQHHPRIPSKDGGVLKRIAIIEVETENLVQGKLRPDEDAMEQIGRGLDDVAGDMKERTMFYRAKAAKMNTWEASLRALGTCAYYGPIAPRHFTRIAYFEPKKNRDMALMMMDGSVSTMAFRICGHFHRNYTRWLFGANISPSDISLIPDEKQQQWLRSVLDNRTGVELVDLAGKQKAA
jgi:hypothetical protein